MKRQDCMPLVEALKQYSEKRPAYFCIPGHRFERGISGQWLAKEDRAFLQYDLTEAKGLDDLHQPMGAIKEAQELASDLFDARDSFFLINGTTAGNEAMIMTVAGPNEKIIIPRNAHKSVMMGLIMSGAKPVYMMPEWMESWGIYGGIKPETVESCLKKHPGSKGVLIVNPSYYGICSDLEAIAQICHAHGALFMVDEAHGAHLYFSKRLPKGALQQQADLCTQSFHKVTGALTQSSMLHIASDRISIARLKANLQMVQSTSPSYLLMASLDAARYELALKGETIMEQTFSLTDYARAEIDKIPGMRCMDETVVGKNGVHGLDTTRLTISASELGINGFELQERLMEVYGVDTELADYHNVLAIVTFANEKEEVRRLIDALYEIAKMTKQHSILKKEKIQMPPLPEMIFTPREAHFKEKRRILWQDAKGKIAGESIIPYPPGIPVIYPGEALSQEVWDYIERVRQDKRHFQGISDKDLDTFEIIVE